MIPTIQILIMLLVVIAGVALVAERLELPPAILLVIAGVALALFPGLPNVRLAPEFVLLFVLPPIIYSSAVAMSWREFRFNLRPISLLAVGCVLFTTAAAAAVTHWLLGFTWSVGFLLGAIVSPPDAVAPLSIARRMQLPRRLAVILEGEGLANDASALILYRFAIAAVSFSVFSWSQAAGMFAAIIGGEILWGIGVGWLMLRLRRWVHDTRIEITLSVLTPFVAYWPPEYLGGSGVLATVTAGLYISWNGLRLISAATRLQGIFFWDFLIYLTEGFVFLITGLQARTLIAGIRGDSWSDLAASAAVVCAVVIMARFVWMFPATYLPRWLIPSIARKDPAPPWQWPFAIAFTGIRGTVSLAAALAIPLTTESGASFPERDRISVPDIFGDSGDPRRPGLAAARRDPSARARQRGTPRAPRRPRRGVCRATAGDRGGNEAVSTNSPPNASSRRICFGRCASATMTGSGTSSTAATATSRTSASVEQHDEIEFLLIEEERQRINDLYRAGKLKDEARRRIERELDLREAQLTNVRAAE